MPSRIKGLLVNFGLLLVTLLVTAALFEAGLRLFGYEPRLPYVNYLGREQVRDALPGVPYLYRSHASFSQSWPSDPRGYFNEETLSVSYEVNNFGFRGDDLSIERGRSVRIALLGDSFCWGNGVHGVDTLARILDRQMGPDYEVYSFCLAGYNTQHEAALYEQVVRHFRPDVLIVWFFLNDVNTPPMLYFNWHDQVGGEWLTEERKRWRLLDLAVAPIDRYQTHRGLVDATQEAFSRGHRGHDSVADALARMGRINEEDGVRPFLVIFPWLYRLNPDRYPFLDAHRVITGLAEGEGFSVLDLLPVYSSHAAQNLWVYPTDQHPNEIGHRLAADAMMEKLKSELPEAVARNRRQAPAPRQVPEGDWWKAFRSPPPAASHDEASDGNEF